MATKVVMPEMGEGVTDATIISWLKKEGDTVEQYEPLVEVNTDKVDSEVPSPVAGTILKIMQAPNSVVTVEQILCWIGEPGEDIPDDADVVPAAKATTPEPAVPAKTPPPTHTPSPPFSQPIQPALVPTGARLSGAVSPLAARVAAEHGVEAGSIPGTGSGGQVTKGDVLRFVQNGGAAPTAAPVSNGPRSAFISPVVARLSAENGIDLSRVSGTGKDGRITKKDIARVISAGGVDPIAPATATPTSVQAVPQVTSGPAGPVEAYAHITPGSTLKLSPVRKSIAKHMRASIDISPHVTTIMEADMSAVWAHRAANKAAFAQDGAKLTFTAYFVSAVVSALKAYAIVNSSWSEEGVVIHREVNIGMAVSMDADGLIVPVIKNADGLSLLGISRAVNDLAARARAKQLKPDEVRGGTFTITNHGTSGSLFATPIINQPQCGILGTGMIQKRAVVINDAIAIRPMAYVGLTFDHRILDGAVADYFLGTIKKTLEEWI